MLLDWCRDQGVQAELHPAVLDAGARRGNGAMSALRDFVTSIDPGVVNVHYPDNAISIKDMIALRLAGIRRLLVTLHHPTPWSETSARKRVLTGLGALLSDGVIVPSTATMSVIRQAHVPRRLIHRIPWGVPPPLHPPNKLSVRQRLGIAADTFVIGSLARLVAYKGISELIEATGRLPADSPLLLLIAGEGPERTSLEALAREHLGERVRFMGRIDDTADLYAAADVFALPSYLEGFGLVYVEAAHHEVPSVAAAVGAVPEVVIDGETGWLVPPRDIAALADALHTMQANPETRRAMGRRARQRARTEFGEELMLRRYRTAFGWSALSASNGVISKISVEAG
jgi:glycosyltransferase involved in cell wall biosynthesis